MPCIGSIGSANLVLISPLFADALGPEVKERIDADEVPEKRMEQAYQMMAQFPVDLVKNINLERKPGEGKLPDDEKDAINRALKNPIPRKELI